MSYYSHLECHQCGEKYDKTIVHSYCKKCTQPLIAKYSLHPGITKEIIRKERSDMWRYADLLPIEDESNIVTLGEGWTPMLELKKTAAASGVSVLHMKEEGLNPTGSFKARGIGMAVSKAQEHFVFLLQAMPVVHWQHM